MGRIRKPTKEEVSERRRVLAERAAAADLVFPDCVRDMRLSLGMSQADFAKMLGMRTRVIAELEAGDANPTLETISRICKPFGFRVGFVPRARAAPPRPLA